MTIGITMLICSLLYIILTAVMYYSKQRLNNEENKIYSGLIISAIIGILLELSCIFLVSNEKFSGLNMIVNRIFLLYILTWVFLFTIYVYSISFNNNSKMAVKIKRYQSLLKIVLFLTYIIFATLLVTLPLDFYYDGVYVYSYGAATNFLYFINTFLIIIWLICLFINIKEVNHKKYIPLFTFILCALINLIVREINPGILLITTSQTFITIMMYFTIENPDVKTIEQLNYAKLQAESLDYAKNKFLRNMSHELMTPLNKVKGINYFNLNSKDQEIKENAELIDMILDEVVEISRNIIDTIKLESGTFFIEKSNYKPRELIDKIIKLNSRKLNEKNLILKKDVLFNIPEELYGDHEKIKQILMQIMSNAIKYTNKGTIYIYSESKIVGDKCNLTVSIQDTGIGIKKKNQKYLFKNFSRIDVENNRTIMGMGLGLSISKQILELMNGTIDVVSNEGKGSKFTITIPQELVKEQGGNNNDE